MRYFLPRKTRKGTKIIGVRDVTNDAYGFGGTLLIAEIYFHERLSWCNVDVSRFVKRQEVMRRRVSKLMGEPVVDTLTS